MNEPQRIKETSTMSMKRDRQDDAEMTIEGFIIAHVRRGDGREDVYETHNLVTDAGDIYYAQKAVGETPTNAFGTLELGTAGNAPAKGSTRADVTTKVASSQKAVDATYPKRDDSDTNNTGRGAKVVSWRYSYAKGAVVSNGINRGIITNTSPGASEPVLTYFTFGTAFDVTADDTLTIYTNHSFAGV